MKKRLFFGGLLIVICLVGIFTYRSFFVPTGNTIESREKILAIKRPPHKEYKKGGRKIKQSAISNHILYSSKYPFPINLTTSP